MVDEREVLARLLQLGAHHLAVRPQQLHPLGLGAGPRAHQLGVAAHVADRHPGPAQLLAAKVTERSAEAGEHYITRDRPAYLRMVRQAAGGGALTAVTVLMKFAIVALGLSAFWNGFWAGAMYAASFVTIQLLHLTLATKQPAMTAPAMAARLHRLDGPAVEAEDGSVQYWVHGKQVSEQEYHDRPQA